MNDTAFEVNFDAIVGPTHNYAGLSCGNLASQRHRGTTSNPRLAALQGLEKMKLLMDLGIKQAVLPPQDRPDVAALRRLGFGGTDTAVIEQAHRQQPALLAACASASSMWVATAATVSPRADTADGRVHITPANLVSQPHRAIEPEATASALKAIFHDDSVFAHHPPLPAAAHLSDEGAANHTRLCRAYHEPGIEIFAYGRAYFDGGATRPTTFPTRQTHEASQAVARLHRLDPARTIFVQQNPAAIDAGVFHNDVIAVGNQNVLLYHAAAFAGGRKTTDAIRRRFHKVCGDKLVLIEISEEQVSLADAVDSYLFNGQLVTLPDGSMSLVCSQECSQMDSTRHCLQQLVYDDNPIRSVHTVALRQSMQNGGGPACLRWRVALTETELGRVHPGVLLDERRYRRLTDWVERHYRDQLTPDDLGDPCLLQESRTALDQLTRILPLGSFYRFQRTGA